MADHSNGQWNLDRITNLPPPEYAEAQLLQKLDPGFLDPSLSSFRSPAPHTPSQGLDTIWGYQHFPSHISESRAAKLNIAQPSQKIPVTQRAHVQKELQELRGMNFDIDDSGHDVVIQNLDLSGKGWQVSNIPVASIPVWIQLTDDFPTTCPGIGFSHPGRAIHVPSGLNWYGKKLNHVYECSHVSHGWWWICFREIRAKNLVELIAAIDFSMDKRKP